MRIGNTIDENGFYTGDVLSESGVVPDVTVICPDGFYKPKWNGTAWAEGLTQEEIDAIVNTPVPKTPDQQKIDQLTLQSGDLLFRLAQAQIELNNNKSQTAMMLFQLATIQGGI